MDSESRRGGGNLSDYRDTIDPNTATAVRHVCHEADVEVEEVVESSEVRKRPPNYRVLGFVLADTADHAVVSCPGGDGYGTSDWYGGVGY